MLTGVRFAFAKLAFLLRKACIWPLKIPFAKVKVLVTLEKSWLYGCDDAKL